LDQVLASGKEVKTLEGNLHKMKIRTSIYLTSEIFLCYTISLIGNKSINSPHDTSTDEQDHLVANIQFSGGSLYVRQAE
jgi:hypothetical protein